ncbi:MAG TPA: 30S ribosome-binding factor RbfA [Longimicrobiales bacterium]|nr:30S ribosome-binding factor RbfA [Longimicrobiales bacterium]
MPRRVERLNEQFRREITDILRGQAKDPRVGLVTITDARVSPDLSFARVFVSPLADGSGNAELLDGLRAATPFVRGELGRRLHIRRVPELRFELDETLARARHIEALLGEALANQGREEGDVEASEEDDGS